MNQKQNRTAIYCRLSRDDGDGESMSITTQRHMLSQYATEQGWPIVGEYIDDGYSGTNFNRPDLKRLQQDILAGKIDVLLTKDLSRLGRDYIETGRLTELFFPEHNVRYIAINDGVDSAKDNNDIVPFKNILNELYAKDNSKKVRSAYRQKAINGEFTAAFAPYGYEKSSLDKHKLVIDEVAAPIIRKIFNWAASGKSPHQIAIQLKSDKVLTPRAYTVYKYERYKTVFNPSYPYDWSHTTIVSLLQNRVYLGHMVNNKSSTKSFKCNKIVRNPKEEWIEVKDTHEALVTEELFNLVQKIISVKKRATNSGERQIFVGLLKCSTCGRSLTYAKQKGRNDNGNFACNLARQKGKEYCSFHYINYDSIYKISLNDLRHQTAFIKENKNSYIEKFNCNIKKKVKEQFVFFHKEKNKLNNRTNELNKILKTLYEDRSFNRITCKEYSLLSSQFESEKEDISNQLNNLIKSLEKESEYCNSINKYCGIIEKHLDIKELTMPLLNRLIEKIVVHDAEDIDGNRTQRVDIYNR